MPVMMTPNAKLLRAACPMIPGHELRVRSTHRRLQQCHRPKLRAECYATTDCRRLTADCRRDRHERDAQAEQQS